jgi:hypothetical protein
MHQSRDNKIRRLFVAMTEILEDRHSDACTGQASRLSPQRYATLARRLDRAAVDLRVSAGEILRLCSAKTKL